MARLVAAYEAKKFANIKGFAAHIHFAHAV
jgi:hypothetical protein